MTWARPALLVLVPLAGLAVVVPHMVRGRRRHRLCVALHMREDAGPERFRAALVLFALSLIAVALAGPRWSSPTPSLSAQGPDVVLLMDVSRSMAVRDVAPSRGMVARMAALRVATGVPSARVGIAAFASDAVLLVAPTHDVGLVTMYIESLDPDVVTAQGSDLARALDVAVEGAGDGVVVLLSDGEGFQAESELDEALGRARSAGVSVHTVLVGTAGGAEIPGLLTSGRSSAQPGTLRRIAEATGGISVNGADGPGVARLVSSLGESGGWAPSEEGVPWQGSLVALAALVALLVESVVARARQGAWA